MAFALWLSGTLLPSSNFLFQFGPVLFSDMLSTCHTEVSFYWNQINFAFYSLNFSFKATFGTGGLKPELDYY